MGSVGSLPAFFRMAWLQRRLRALEYPSAQSFSLASTSPLAYVSPLCSLVRPPSAMLPMLEPPSREALRVRSLPAPRTLRTRRSYASLSALAHCAPPPTPFPADLPSLASLATCILRLESYLYTTAPSTERWKQLSATALHASICSLTSHPFFLVTQPFPSRRKGGPGAGGLVRGGEAAALEGGTAYRVAESGGGRAGVAGRIR